MPSSTIAIRHSSVSCEHADQHFLLHRIAFGCGSTPLPDHWSRRGRPNGRAGGGLHGPSHARHAGAALRSKSANPSALQHFARANALEAGDLSIRKTSKSSSRSSTRGRTSKVERPSRSTSMRSAANKRAGRESPTDAERGPAFRALHAYIGLFARRAEPRRTGRSGRGAADEGAPTGRRHRRCARKAPAPSPRPSPRCLRPRRPGRSSAASGWNPSLMLGQQGW